MYIFLISVLLVSFIGLCFFKKKFWENRYLLLMIIGGVAIVATVTTNYIVRNKYPLVLKPIDTTSMSLFYVNDSLLINGVPYNTDEDFDFSDLKISDMKRMCDTVKINQDSTIAIPKHRTSIFFYDMESKKYSKIGYVSKFNKRKSIYFCSNILTPTTDTVPFEIKFKQVYDIPTNNKWINRRSLPRKKTFRCIYIPEAEYNALPDSLIRELPIKP